MAAAVSWLAGVCRARVQASGAREYTAATILVVLVAVGAARGVEVPGLLFAAAQAQAVAPAAEAPVPGDGGPDTRAAAAPPPRVRDPGRPAPVLRARSLAAGGIPAPRAPCLS